MSDRRIVIVFAGRFPSEKAAGLFVDLNARSLVRAGASVTVLAPRRFGRGSLAETPYTVAYVPTIDLSRVPLIARYANYITVAVFSFFSILWLVRNTHTSDLIISNDALPLIAASAVRPNLLYEMHDYADRSLWMYRLLFSRVRLILATNDWKRKKLLEDFHIPAHKVLLERNAVETEEFGQRTKKEARERTGLDPSALVVLYTGHLYEWKGADTLAEAAARVPEATFVFVGGTEADVSTFRTKWGSGSNIRIIGQVGHDVIPEWQSSADVLVLPNSAKEEISVHYTSPMKLFEYMASERPIVAADLPSIREILVPEIGYFAEPDNAASFAAAIQRALRDPERDARACRAREVVLQYSWGARAERILRNTL